MHNEETFRIIKTNRAPQAIGPYSQAIAANGLLFISGQLPIDPDSGEFIPGGIKEKTHQCLKNILEIAKESDTSLDRSVKITVYLTDMNLFEKMNEAYQSHFNRFFPARSVVQVSALPKNADIEIEAILKL